MENNELKEMLYDLAIEISRVACLARVTEHIYLDTDELNGSDFHTLMRISLFHFELLHNQLEKIEQYLQM